MFMIVLLSSPFFPQLKQSRKFPFSSRTFEKVVRVKLCLPCKVLCLHISSESLFPRFQDSLGGWFKVLRILFIYLPYIVLEDDVKRLAILL